MICRNEEWAAENGESVEWARAMWWCDCSKCARPADEKDAGCPTCEAVTPTGIRRRDMGGFACPTCGHVTPRFSVGLRVMLLTDVTA